MIALHCVLFDLDGTLVDTAPDLIACLNLALEHHGYPAADEDELKPFISFGALAMIRQSIDETDENIHNAILDWMLNCYENNIAKQSRLFQGIDELLNLIESSGLKWGIVTNKRERFTLPLIKALELENRISCVISGDTTANSKPHPEPLLTACDIAQVRPEHCIYIGDAAHDIQAGKSAGMKTLAATYGYLKPHDNPSDWGADALMQTPAEITYWIQQCQTAPQPY